MYKIVYGPDPFEKYNARKNKVTGVKNGINLQYVNEISAREQGFRRI